MQKIFLLLLFTGVISLRPAILKAQPVTHPYKDMETELLQIENDYRKTIGAKPMRASIYVSNIAQRHSQDMATKKVIFTDDTGQTPVRTPDGFMLKKTVKYYAAFWDTEVFKEYYANPRTGMSNMNQQLYEIVRPNRPVFFFSGILNGTFQ